MVKSTKRKTGKARIKAIKR
jgi:hypothetical protein